MNNEIFPCISNADKILTASYNKQMADSEAHEHVNDSTSSLEQDNRISKKEYVVLSILRPYVTRDDRGNFMLMETPLLGYAYEQDTSKINSYFSLENIRAIFPYGIIFKWAATTEKGVFSLVGYKHNLDSLSLDTFDVKSITVNLSLSSKTQPMLTGITKDLLGKNTYTIVINLNSFGLTKLNRIPDKSSLLFVSVNLNGKKFYCASTCNTIYNEGITIGNDINKGEIDAIETNYKRFIKEKN